MAFRGVSSIYLFLEVSCNTASAVGACFRRNSSWMLCDRGTASTGQAARPTEGFSEGNTWGVGKVADLCQKMSVFVEQRCMPSIPMAYHQIPDQKKVLFGVSPF